MNVSVVLVAYKGDRWLPACLDSLSEATGSRLHLILVDNAGNTIIDDLDLSPFDAEVIATPRPMGFADANNFALVEAGGLEEAVLFLNQDTVSPEGWIDDCTAVLDARSELGAVSPCIRTYEGDGWDPSFLACLPSEVPRSAELDESEETVIRSGKVPAPALLVRTSILEEAGPFDPVFGSYYEDYDLCRRIRALGYEVGFHPGAHIRHFSGGSTETDEEERRRMRQVIRNRILYELRKRRTPRWWAALGWFAGDFPRRLARGCLRTPSSQPPAVTVKAYGDLIRLGPRLVSRSADRNAWERYLEELGWPPDRRSSPRQRPANQAIETA